MTMPDYEDVTKYGLDQAAEAELLARQIECTFIWSNSEGHPLGVIMNYVFRDGRFWLTASSQRARVPAVRRDPRVSVVVTSRGSGITTSQSLTYKGRCVVHEDEAVKIVLDADTTGAQTKVHQKHMMGDVAKLVAAGKNGHGIGWLDPAAYQRTVSVLLASGSDPVITKQPEGAWTHDIWDKMGGK